MVEIIPKPVKKGPLAGDIFLYVSVIVLILAGVIYFISGYLIKERQQFLSEQEVKLAQMKTPEMQEIEREIFYYKSKIDAFSLLLGQHTACSNLFSLLEETTHPQVWFSDLNLDVRKNSVILSGQGEKTSLGQQLMIFSQDERFLASGLTSIQPKEGEMVAFSIALSFKTEIFKFLK